MAKKTRTESRLESKVASAYIRIAADLREFGYPDVTTDMIEEIHEAYRKGKRGGDLPHGVIGIIVGKGLDDA